MGEIRCNLDWTGAYPKLVLDLEAELTDSQVRAIAYALSRKAQEILNCLLECGGVCPKEENNGGTGNPETQH